MNFHEYQSKELFAQYAIPIPGGRIVAKDFDTVRSAAGVGRRF